jgi:GST-like protein
VISLYHWEPNANSMKVLVCLREKGLEFESHYVDLLALAQFRPDFLELNPFGQVPVLVDRGTAMAESTVINEYLEEAYPQVALAPRDPRGWYDLQGWSKFIDYNLSNSLATLGWWQVTRPAMAQAEMDGLRARLGDIPVKERADAWHAALADEPVADQIENSRRKIGLAVERIEGALGQGDWLMGNSYTLADINAFAFMRTLPALEPDLVNAAVAPRTVAWIERMSARPAVVEALAMARLQSEPGAYAPGPEHSRWG